MLYQDVLELLNDIDTLIDEDAKNVMAYIDNNIDTAYHDKELINRCKKIKHIRIMCISSIPHSISIFSNLVTLEIFNISHISEIPYHIENLKKLEILNIWSNPIKKISDNICNLKNLKILQLPNAKIERLPENMSNLKKLKYLNLYGNSLLTHVPESVFKIKKCDLGQCCKLFKDDPKSAKSAKCRDD